MLPEREAGAERDQHRARAEGDDGGHRQAGRLHRGEVGGLEHREAQPRHEGAQGLAGERFAHGGAFAAAPERAGGEQQEEPDRAAPERQGDGPHVAGPVDQRGRGTGGAPGDTGDDQIEEATPDGQAGNGIRHDFSPQTRTGRGSGERPRDGRGRVDCVCGQHRPARRSRAGLVTGPASGGRRREDERVGVHDPYLRSPCRGRTTPVPVRRSPPGRQSPWRASRTAR